MPRVIPFSPDKGADSEERTMYQAAEALLEQSGFDPNNIEFDNSKEGREDDTVGTVEAIECQREGIPYRIQLALYASRGSYPRVHVRLDRTDQSTKEGDLLTPASMYGFDYTESHGEDAGVMVSVHDGTESHRNRGDDTCIWTCVEKCGPNNDDLAPALRARLEATFAFVEEEIRKKLTE